MRTRHRSLALFVVAGLATALALAFFVSPRASTNPDGLEKVAADRGIDAAARDHALADSPLADYSVDGVDRSPLSTGLAGVVGVIVTFAVGVGVFAVVRMLRRRDEAAPTALTRP
jgi:cobalt/nickel transport system permease protein